MTDNWYDNKEIYEMLQEVRQDMSALREVMAATRTLIRDYNSLRQKLEETATKVNTLMWLTPIAIAATGVLFTILNFFLK
jgi:endonuclease/exonuclease/phosphatase family metal-dependent hydrolase